MALPEEAETISIYDDARKQGFGSNALKKGEGDTGNVADNLKVLMKGNAMTNVVRFGSPVGEMVFKLVVEMKKNISVAICYGCVEGGHLRAKESSQPESLYEAAATLTEFELKKILIDKMDKSESYLAAPEHRECYEGLKKSYDLDKTIFSTYDRGLKKRKTSKDAAPATGPKAKESQSGSSQGDKSQSKSSIKSVKSKEPEFEVADSDMPQDQEENLGKDNEEPKEKVPSKRDWFTKTTQPQEPIDPDWNVDKTPQQEQNHCWLMTLASFAEKPSKTFDELMSTPIDFYAFC
ncbi:hypothetical protein Tco_1438913 [Tanacetum coccineum]